MKVDLRSLKPNPTRDMAVDPINSEAIEKIEKSIDKHKFWGGIVVGKLPNGGLAIMAGHSRAQAAINAGINTADLYVADGLTPEQMLGIYITENATQRGNNSSALAGGVAGALKLIAKQVAGNPATCSKDGRGGRPDIGWKPILDWLTTNAPASGINKNVVVQQLANLKASGDYGRIVSEAIAEIEPDLESEAADAEREAEEQAAVAELNGSVEAKKKAKAAREKADNKKQAKARAKKTKDVAISIPRTFDLEGVQKYLKDPSHVEMFREKVTGQGLAPYLPVNKQADLAKRIVELAKLPAAQGGRAEKGGKVTSDFIDLKLYPLAMNLRDAKNRLTKEQEAKLERSDITRHLTKLQHHFARQIISAHGDLMKLIEIEKEKLKPKHEHILPTVEFRDAMRFARKIVVLADKAGL